MNIFIAFYKYILLVLHLLLMHWLAITENLYYFSKSHHYLVHMKLLFIACPGILMLYSYYLKNKLMINLVLLSSMDYDIKWNSELS